MELKSPIVSVDWLHQHLDVKGLIVLNATIPKVVNDVTSQLDIQIPKAKFFDIKKKFSMVDAEFPNTIPTSEQFSKEAGRLGIKNDSIIVVYDELGIYSSARAWWLFKAFGYDNVAVLDGGLPEWLAKDFPVEDKQVLADMSTGFEVDYQSEKMVFFEDIETISKDSNYNILDARSEARFKGLMPEPRIGLRSGTIPNSMNLPFSELLDVNTLKSEDELKTIFNTLVKPDQKLVMSCGSGITACVLALGACTAGYKHVSVYDGSWTEYGSLTEK